MPLVAVRTPDMTSSSLEGAGPLSGDAANLPRTVVGTLERTTDDFHRAADAKRRYMGRSYGLDEVEHNHIHEGKCRESR